MGRPSIYVPGNLIATKAGPQQAELNSKVPLDYIMEFVRSRLSRKGSPANRILVCKSSTGSGKSTAIPPELFHLFFEPDRRSIVCTQPRALTAAQMPNQIIPHHNAAAFRESGSGRTPLVMGENIGYQTGPSTNRAARGINFVTTNVLVRQLKTMSDEEFMDKYGFALIKG